MWRAEIVDDAAALERQSAAWDELAVASSQPYAAPAWMLAWWRHAAPPSATLRTVLVFDDAGLAAVAPFFAEPGVLGTNRYRILGAGCSSRVDLVARRGIEEERVASAVARALATASPSPDVVVFDGVWRASPWPRLLALAWPQAELPVTRRAFTLAAPTMSLAGAAFRDWYASKSRNFRQTLRRRRRRLEERGAAFSLLTDPSDLARELSRFSALHRGRWEIRGGSRVLNPGVERMLQDAGRRLVPEGRMRLWSIGIGDRAISSHMFLSAGSRTTYWLGGFDDRWAWYQPAMLTLLAAIEHEFAAGTETVDLGTGDQAYKARLADGSEHVEWVSLVPRAPLARVADLAFARQRLRLGAAKRLPPPVKRAVRAVARARRRPVG